MEQRGLGKRHKKAREKTVKIISKIPEPLKDACDLLGSAIFRVNDKAISGVYFLCEGDKVNYVGQSKDIKQRIRTHQRQKSKSFDSVFAVRLPQEQLVKIEGMFIQLLCPKYNMNGGHSLRAINRTMELLVNNGFTPEQVFTGKKEDKKTVTISKENGRLEPMETA